MAGTVRKIVIIGGGIAGLCAGVYARRCGYEVDLVEMHERPGGPGVHPVSVEFDFV